MLCGERFSPFAVYVVDTRHLDTAYHIGFLGKPLRYPAGTYNADTGLLVLLLAQHGR